MKVNRAFVSTALLIAAGFTWGALRDGGFLQSGGDDTVAGQQVQRGPLRVTVVQRGNLSAKNSTKVVSELEGNVQILELVEEGKLVTVGEQLVKLDTSSLEDRENAGRIAVQNARASLETAKGNLEIQVSQNESDKAKAGQDLQFALDDQRKYLEGDFPQQLEGAEEAILLAGQELTQAEDRYLKSKELFEADFLTETELEMDRLALERSKVALNQANRAKELLLVFEKPKQVAVHKGQVEEAEREVRRVELQSEARLLNAQASVATSQAKFDLEKEKLDKLRDQLGKATILSPAEGIVVYARERSRWGQGDLIEKGATVRERQEIITIPQSGGMIAEASLHESVIKKVQVGQECVIRVDAIPGSRYRGVVEFVALLPDSGSSWMNPNQRLFRTNVAVTDADPEMRPGMSCSIEILIDEIPDTLYVPLQAIFHSGGKSICFVGGEVRSVTTGASSEKWVQVLSGLEAGEVVQLAPPRDFKPEPAPKSKEGMPGGGPSGGPGSGGGGHGG